MILQEHEKDINCFEMFELHAGPWQVQSTYVLHNTKMLLEF